MSGALHDFLETQIREGVFPGAAWAVSTEGRLVSEGALGDAVRVPERIPAQTGTLYDLASLTKPLAAALIAVRLQALGRLRLDQPVERYLPEWRPGEDRAGLTLLDLLTHRSGLPAWDPLYAHAGDIPGRIARLASIAMAHPPLVDVTYSCPNYILAGFALERAGGAGLAILFRDLVAGPLGVEDLLFVPPARLRRRIAATEEGNERERTLAGAAGQGYNAWRTGIIWGEVHDHNAHTLGGAAGNAGLFGTARAVHAVALEFLPGSRLLSEEERALFLHNFTPGVAQHRSVGFQLATTAGGSAGPGLGPRSFGHTGFTGTSVWVDPDARRVAILLTNRVHPRFRDQDMNAVRRDFHALAATI